MFPDSAIADSFKLSRSKWGYLINHGFAPYFSEVLLSEIESSPFCVISFDENLNKKVQMGQMDILIRFWNCWDKILQLLLHILTCFEKGIQKFNLSKLIQISSDGPNVNLKFLRLFSGKRELDELPSLLDIGTCGLHNVHGSLKSGVKNSGWNIGKILKAIFFLLHDTPARRDVCENVTETNQYPLQYCGHRWCENEDVTERADVIWPCIVKFVRYLMSLPESQQPKGKTYNSTWSC